MTKPEGPKILTLDIETSFNIGDIWGLFNQNISLSQLRESQRVISFAAKWHDARKVEFASEYHNNREEMLQLAHELVDRADIVVHYNGNRFDIPHLQAEWARLELQPPSPHKNVDLLTTVKKQFRFPSNKLDYVAGELLAEHKVEHEGHDLWVKCLMDPQTPEEVKVKEAAWRRMRTYNKGDVVLTEKLYDRLLPWIKNHPHVGLYSDDPKTDRCGNCGSTDITRQGYAYTPLGKYQQFKCKACGRWSRGKKNLQLVDVRPAA